MPRSARSIKLETRTARLKLPLRNAPYFIKVAKGLRLGYYRGRDAGTWIGRRYVGSAQYETQAIGVADDTIAADNIKIFDYWQAQEVLRRWAERSQLTGGGVVRSGPYTVKDAIEDYLQEIAVEKKTSALKSARYIFTASILPELGHLLVDNLTPDLLGRWRNNLSSRPKRVRTKATAPKHATRETPDDEDARRKRRATANRILTMLKAALNRAYNSGRVSNDNAWRRIKPFKQADQAVIHYLSPDEVTRLVSACTPDFRQLVIAAVLTGCRYSELTNLTCHDFNVQGATLTLRQTKAGKARHVVLTTEGYELMLQLTAGRPSSAPVFLRADGNPWGPSHQQRPLEAAAVRASISPAPTFHILRHTYGSTLAMRGVPMGVIAAQLGHSDTRMTEKHYAHLAPSYVAETIRLNFPALGLVNPPTIVPLRRSFS